MTKLNLQGYSIAFLAVCWYNYSKIRESSAAPAGGGGDAKPAAGDVETTGLSPEKTRLLRAGSASTPK